jgi:hypothetical protein
MKRQLILIGLTALLIGFGAACRKLIIEKPVENTPTSNFEYLWTQIRNKYSFMDYKGLNWDAVHAKYAPQINDKMSNQAFFSVMEDMMNELKDGHANLFSPYRTSNYLPVFTGSPVNYNGDLVFRNYILRDPKNYYQIGPFTLTTWDTLGVKVGYMRYSSFLNAVSDNNMQTALNYFAHTDGLIIDLRSNGGGNPQNIFEIAKFFCPQKTLAYTSFLKSGPGPNDFTEGAEAYIEGTSNAYTKRVAILTNRGCFSATSFFCVAMRNLPQVRMIGDSTGGGLGAPSGGQLPNGWAYRFSVTQTLSPETDGSGNHYNWESGVPAHIIIDMDPTQAANGFDSILERGIQYIITGI